MMFWQRDAHLLNRFATGILLMFMTAHLIYMIVPGYGPYWYLKGTFRTSSRAARSGGWCARRSTPAARRRTSSPASTPRRRRSSPSSASATASTSPVQVHVAGHGLRRDADHRRDDVPALALPHRHRRRPDAGDDAPSSSASAWPTGSAPGASASACSRRGCARLPWGGRRGSDQALAGAGPSSARATPMLGFEIIGTGHYVPGQPGHQRRPVAGDGHQRRLDLPALGHPPAPLRARGLRRSDFARRGEHAAPSRRRGIAPGEIDYVVFATMTPDYVFPGSGALLAHKLGLTGRPGARHPPAVRGDALRACRSSTA